MSNVNVLLERRRELSDILRRSPTNLEEFVEVLHELDEMNNFLTRFGRIAGQLKSPLGIIFDALFHPDGALEEETPAFVGLNRLRESLNREAFEELQLQSERLQYFVSLPLNTVEELGDVRRDLALADDYLQALGKAAGIASEEMKKRSPEALGTLWNAYQCNTVIALQFICRDALHKQSLTTSSQFPSDSVDVRVLDMGCFSPLRPIQSPVAATMGLLTIEQALEWISGLCRSVLSSNHQAAPDRLQALQEIARWFSDPLPELSQSDELQADLFIVVLGEALTIHLAEKRSAICRAACDVLSSLLRCCGVRGVEQSLDAQAFLSQWVHALLKQVHVSVAPIALSTSSTMRLLVLTASGSVDSITLPIFKVIQTATRPQLQCSCLGFIALTMLSASFADRRRLFPSALEAVLPCLRCGSEKARRLARCIAQLYIIAYPGAELNNEKWDSRTASIAEQDEEYLVRGLLTPGSFEVDVLGADFPSFPFKESSEKRSRP